MLISSCLAVLLFSVDSLSSCNLHLHPLLVRDGSAHTCAGILPSLTNCTIACNEGYRVSGEQMQCRSGRLRGDQVCIGQSQWRHSYYLNKHDGRSVFIDLFSYLFSSSVCLFFVCLQLGMLVGLFIMSIERSIHPHIVRTVDLLIEMEH